MLQPLQSDDRDAAALAIGIDTGGTFTDVLALDPDGGLRAAKLPSTPADPAQAVITGVALLRGDAASAAPGAPLTITHGTTVATNALLERRGGPTALLVTAGFTDVLRLGRQARAALYALNPVQPPPLCPPELCIPVEERLGPDGAVLTPLRPETLAALREQVAALHVASVAVVLLHSYRDDRHERLIGEALAPLGLPVSLSSQVLPAPREYERAVATAADAYVAPRVSGYLQRLEAAFASQPGARLRVMQSSGGASLAAEALRSPVRTILSGPAAGVIGAQALASLSGVTRAITFDMGGTSTDVALLEGAGPALTSEAELAGLPLHLPMLAVHTVGAGGGSLITIDGGGALQVGPASAGADPGPACFGRGGRLPTLTDADLLLGRLHPARFCGGQLSLSADAAAAALGEIAARLSLPVLDVAAGATQVTGALLARAVRTITVERGHDPADFTLLPYGGAGGLHAAALAEELGVRRVLIPPSPGLVCAYGALCAPVVRERAQTLLCPAAAQAEGRVAAALAALLTRVRADMEREGAAQGAVVLSWSAELRYQGQSYELTVAGAGDGGPAHHPDQDLAQRFQQEHQRHYGFTLPGRSVELVALRARGVAKGTPPAPAALAALHHQSGAAVADLGEITMTFPTESGARAQRARLIDRAALRPGATLSGPALLIEYSATTVLPGGWRAEVDAHGALHLSA